MVSKGMWVMDKKFLSGKADLPDTNSPRPNLADIPSMDNVLELYEKVLSELDLAISSQREFAADKKRIS